jgi:hypothetical protein
MKNLFLFTLLAFVSACSDAPSPSLAPSPDPNDPASPTADIPYRPVMAGTVSHGVGGRP